MGRELDVSYSCCKRNDDRVGACYICFVYLDYKGRPYACLFRPYHRIQIDQENISSFYLHVIFPAANISS
jgi:hypothetical protein